VVAALRDGRRAPRDEFAERVDILTRCIGRLVTGAAAIMITVFVAFGLARVVTIKATGGGHIKAGRRARRAEGRVERG
jgi:hypothetical protein